MTYKHPTQSSMVLKHSTQVYNHIKHTTRVYYHTPRRYNQESRDEITRYMNDILPSVKPLMIRIANWL